MAYVTENSKTVKLSKAYLAENGVTVKGSKIYLVENNITSLLWSNGLGIFVAGGDSGKVAHSADGITWTVYTATLDGATISYSIKSITYGNGVFVAAMFNNTNKNVLCYSVDGINFFTAVASDNLNAVSGSYKIAYGNGRFLAISYTANSCWYSSDGKTWTKGAYRPLVRSLSFVNGHFYSLGYGTDYYRSTDCITWETLSGLYNGSSNYPYQSGVVYAFGYYHTVMSNGNYYRSTDGLTWTQVGTHPTSTVSAYGMMSSNNVISIMVYNRNLPECSYIDSSGYYSGTGLNADSASNACKAVAFSDKFVAVGGASSSGYSADGKTWTQTTISSESITFNDVCYAIDGGGKAS